MFPKYFNYLYRNVGFVFEREYVTKSMLTNAFIKLYFCMPMSMYYI